MQKLGDTAVAEVGGKAAQLARLQAAGLPVPATRVIPASTFRQALSQSGLLPRARAVHEDADAAVAASLAEQIAADAVPRAWASQWVTEARRLGRVLAVRSSAVDEDGAERSFAGQYLTELYVRPEDVPAAVARCWASLYNAESLAYRAGKGPSPGSMAVVVQAMVEPRSAGVLFTMNPMNGSWREMVVEAVWGLGEGLVSGRIAPHWYLVRRPRALPGPLRRVWNRVRLQTMQQTIDPIATQLVGGEDGVREAPVPSSHRGTPTLTPRQLHRLCRLGLKVERLLGEPVDVEWALDRRGRLLLLQARPITSSAPARPRDDVLYTRRFIGERFPSPPTVLGWSILAPELEHFIGYPETQARYLGGGPALKLHQGRPYLNTTVFRHLAFKLPGAPAPRFMTELVPPDEERAWRRRFAMMPDVDVYASILRTTLQERRWRRFHWNPLTNHRGWDRFESELGDALPALGRIPDEVDAKLALVHTHQRWLRRYIGIHICSLLFANLFYQLLEAALATWFPEQSVDWLEALATCPPGNRTLETNEALWGLAQQLSEADVDALSTGEALSEAGTAALATFLEGYGHRSTASWDVMAPRWQHQPGELAPLLRAQRGTEPAVHAAAQEARFDKVMGAVRLATKGTPRATWMEGLVFYTRRYLLLRENQRFAFDRLQHSLQRVLYALGEDLVERGELSSAAQVRWLTVDEVRGLARGQLTGAQSWVARRTESVVASEPPVFLRGEDGMPQVRIGARLEGLGISPGRRRGTIRVLRAVSEGDRVQPGDILVTRAIDPAWTPLLMHAGGVVLEMGSLLSHAAVVAREYGVPGVVNIEGATEVLRDGQEVTVDGTRGLIWVHP